MHLRELSSVRLGGKQRVWDKGVAAQTFSIASIRVPQCSHRLHLVAVYEWRRSLSAGQVRQRAQAPKQMKAAQHLLERIEPDRLYKIAVSAEFVRLEHILW